MHKGLIYDVDDRPPVREGLALGAQHLVAMLLGNITPPLLIAGALGLVAGQTGVLVQAVLLVAGLSTLVQAYPIGPVGGRIPIVMGTSIAFVGGSIAVGSRAGLAAVFGACLVAAVVEVVIGFSFSRVRRWFPPLVTSVVAGATTRILLVARCCRRCCQPYGIGDGSVPSVLTVRVDAEWTGQPVVNVAI